LNVCFIKEENVGLVRLAEGLQGVNCSGTSETTAIPGKYNHGTEGDMRMSALFRRNHCESNWRSKEKFRIMVEFLVWDINGNGLLLELVFLGRLGN
jgi:hypothetical protein